MLGLNAIFVIAYIILDLEMENINGSTFSIFIKIKMAKLCCIIGNIPFKSIL